ncbi:MAG: type II toxin-antitoxin system death-on-curing family toxin [Patescibacteria group bacterium]
MQYVKAEYIVALHAALIEETGGIHGIRDQNLLASLAVRPQQKFAGKELYPDIFQKAAVYLEGIARNHVFADGNKRTAVATAAYFLHLNGCELKSTNRELEKFVLKVVTEKLSLEPIADWLKEHSYRRKI